jgi:hypothetical protein
LTIWLQDHGETSVQEMDGEDEIVYFNLPDLTMEGK